jgi:3-hydroxybutyryl-CoA dehydratase
MIYAQPHERFSATVALDPQTTSAFAHSVGDTNPVHHDAAVAAQSRFGRLIASGPHTTAHLLALTASHFSKRGAWSRVLGSLQAPDLRRRNDYAGVAGRFRETEFSPRRRNRRFARPHSQ